ncbi:hypothetical protein BOO86_08960 [Mycobacterium sp. CBMA 234]|uniref:acetoacetate decarboxylase family protein n=1 Tax=Mycolicibacterium sp. CBMA 234 TaxID=1918495 RepID=UPI001391064D|nr:acetoacetate decarboxylase family protein [Mycolicibacterium sp. CBMA 234]MUL64589.1 hypothetical protein [Mycolicibacterium sp. CBMA 234]
MPATFGRQPGPRQQLETDDRFPRKGASALATWVAGRAACPQKLAELLPAGFTLDEPLLIVEAVTLSNLPWLAGRGYELLMVSVPATYTATDGGRTSGRLALVIWEDCPDAIVSGREELGFSKVYADSMKRVVKGSQTHYTVGWGGTEFFSLDVTLNRKLPANPSWRRGALMHYRVFPRTGQWGRLDLEQVVGSVSQPAITDVRSIRSGAGSFAFTRATFEQLPTLVHIVNRLADVELESFEAGQVRVASWGDVFDQTILDELDGDRR